jgi:hypothetical protein
MTIVLGGTASRASRGHRGVDTTLELLLANALVGVTGVFDPATKRMTSIGIQCALCHSTVDDS